MRGLTSLCLDNYSICDPTNIMIKLRLSGFFPYFLVLLSFDLSLRALGSTEVDFARDVLPVLSNKCFTCHGPDTKEKDLVRLDSEEAAKKDLGGFHAVDEESPKIRNSSFGFSTKRSQCLPRTLTRA